MYYQMNFSTGLLSKDGHQSAAITLKVFLIRIDSYTFVEPAATSQELKYVSTTYQAMTWVKHRKTVHTEIQTCKKADRQIYMHMRANIYL